MNGDMLAPCMSAKGSGKIFAQAVGHFLAGVVAGVFAASAFISSFVHAFGRNIGDVGVGAVKHHTRRVQAWGCCFAVVAVVLRFKGRVGSAFGQCFVGSAIATQQFRRSCEIVALVPQVRSGELGR